MLAKVTVRGAVPLVGVPPANVACPETLLEYESVKTTGVMPTVAVFVSEPHVMVNVVVAVKPAVERAPCQESTVVLLGYVRAAPPKSFAAGVMAQLVPAGIFFTS